MYKTIVVPLDGSKLAESALPIAERIAAGLNARISLISIVDADLAPPAGSRRSAGVAASAVARAEVYLRSVVERVELPRGRVAASAKLAKVAEAIVEEAEREPATLITMSTHGRSGVGRFLLGSVADKVLHATKAPLLLFRPREGAAGKLNTVIVPLDGSELAEKALAHALALAKALSLKVLITRVVPLHVAAVAAADPMAWLPVDADITEALQKEAESYVAKKAQEVKAGGVTDVTTRIFTGAAATAIIDLVHSVPDSFVALTTHGRSGALRTVLGSVADRVVSHAAAPVLVVRP